MHVLVTESHFGEADRLVERLDAIGVQVSRCHDEVGECRVLAPGGHCPLDTLTNPAELVVDVRGAGAELTVREYGTVCAVRARRPVWLVGTDPQVPVVVPPGLRDIAIVATEEELLTHCQRRCRPRPPARHYL